MNWYHYLMLALFVSGFVGMVYMFFTAPWLDDNMRPMPGPGLMPVDFPERTHEVAKDQPEYRTLPAHLVPNDEQGEMITCWQLSWRDRLKILFTGKLWASIWTFNRAVSPMYFSVYKSDVLPKK